MICITSISPTHINNNIQQKAIDSWHKLGLTVYSFNHPSEFTLLKHYKNVIFVPTTQTMEHIFEKPYVSISAMIDWAKNQSENRFCFINSDIELDYNPELLLKIKKHSKHSVIIANRHDYKKTKTTSKKYVLGIDVFFLSKEHLHIFPQGLFCMGQCFWDYNIPFTAIKNDIPVINMQNKFAFHKEHNTQYSSKNWETTGKMFMIEHKINNETVGRVNELTFNFLDLICKKITL